MANTSKVIGWGFVIAAMLGVGLVVGFVFGLLGYSGLLPSGMVPVMTGLVCGLTAPLLILRMRPVR